MTKYDILLFLILSLYLLTAAVWLAKAVRTSLPELSRRLRPLPFAERALLAALLLCAVYVGGAKPGAPANEETGGTVPSGTETAVSAGSGVWSFAVPDPATGGATLYSYPMLTEGGGAVTQRLTAAQYAAGFALTGVFTNAAPWFAVPSNAVTHAPWARYGLAEDTFWLPAAGWGFVLGSNSVEGVHVSSSGTLSFNMPKGSPRPAEMPDGTDISFIAPLHGPLGTVPPGGRFWHAPTPSNSVLLTWQDVCAGRDTNSPVTFQAELFWNGDFICRYAFPTDACGAVSAPALTNFVIGAQNGGGGETYASGDANLLANGLELHWRAFGALDPESDDFDGDGLSDYDEVMFYGTNPTLKDSDFDGSEDAAELASGTYPLDPDTDGDGLADGLDPQPAVWNDPDGDAGNDGLGYLYEVTHGLDPAADNALDSDNDGWADWKELMAGTETNNPSSTPQNADGSCGLFDVTITLNAPLPCNTILSVGGRTVVLRQAGSYTLTLAEGVAHPVSLTVSQPCAVSLSAALGSQYAAFQDSGGVFSGGAAVPGGAPVACGMIAQPALSVMSGPSERICFHSEAPKTVAAKVSPEMAGLCQWSWSGGGISSASGRSANISWDGGGGCVYLYFTASGAAQARLAYREVTKCSRVNEDTWCDDHGCEHWYCACDNSGASDDDDCGFHGQKVSKCREAVCPTHDCPYDDCPDGWCHQHDTWYSDCGERWCHICGGDPSLCGHGVEVGGDPGGDGDPGEEPVFGSCDESLATVNNDDDDASGSEDSGEAPVAGENDLAAVWPLGYYDGQCCPCPEHHVPPEGSQTAELESCSARLALYADAGKTNTFGTVVHAAEEVWVEGLSASTAVEADRIVWKWTDENNYVHRVTNAFTVLSVRLFGDLDLDGEVDADDKALHPALSHEYGWGMPAATNVFRPVRLRTDVGLSGGVYTLSLSGPDGMCRIWTTGSPASTNSPLLMCGQTVTNGVNGDLFLSGGDSELYVEAVSNGTATITYAYAGTGSAAGISCSASLTMTAWEIDLRSVERGTNGYPIIADGQVVLGERIPWTDSLSTYVPFDGGGAPAMVSTSPRWVAFTVITNAVTNSATLSMTQEYTEGFKVWDMDFEGVTTNGTFAYIWQGESNAFLRAEYPTNATGATMPLTLSMLDADFEGLTNEVSETYDVYRDATLTNYYSTYSITGPRADIGRPAFSSHSAFVVRFDAKGANLDNPVCEITVEDGEPVAVPLTQEQDGAYVSCLVVPVSELDAEADLGLEGYGDAVKISLEDSPYAGSDWQRIKIDIKGLIDGNTTEIVSLPAQTYYCALFSALVANDDPANLRANEGVTDAGEKARTLLDYSATALLSPDSQTFNNMLPRHSVWVHSGHGGYAAGITVVRKAGGDKYVKGTFKASDISRDDLAYNLVFMNTCESTDQWYRPVRFGDNGRIMGFYDEPPTNVAAHAVRDIGTKLNAVSYVGWDCSVERDVSAYVPSMLMQELDTQVVDGEYVLRSPSEAVNAVRQKLDAKGGIQSAFSRMLRCIPKEGASERVIDLNKKPN